MKARTEKTGLFLFAEKLIQAYRLLNILSIDVAAGAAVCGLFFANLFNVELRPQGWLVLALTVWIIYTADHLLDANQVKHTASTMRHRFHQQHFKTLLVAILIVVVADLYLVSLIRAVVFRWGLVFALLAALYLFFNRWFRYIKELAAAFLYSGGVLLPGGSLYEGEVSMNQSLLIIQFILIVLINLVLFAWLSYDEDKKDDQKSIATLLGLQRTRWVLTILFVLLGGAILWSMSQEYFREKLVLLFMATLLLIIFGFPSWFKVSERFRLAGDAVFLFPAASIIFS